MGMAAGMRMRAGLIGAVAVASTPVVGPARAQPAPTDALGCMTAAIYYEAAREPDQGQQAVARVVLNRLADPAYPKSVCAVIFEGSARRTGCQFTFTCDGALSRRPDAVLWARAGVAATAALASPEALPGLAAVNYHANYVRPLWAARMHEEARIGRHIFYTRSVSARWVPGAPAVGVSFVSSATTFSPWGLPVARITPAANGNVSVTDLATGG